MEKTEEVLSRGLTNREALTEVRRVLTGPSGARVIRASVTKKPSKKVLALHRKIHDALVLLHDRERPPYPADHVVMEKMERIFR